MGTSFENDPTALPEPNSIYGQNTINGLLTDTEVAVYNLIILNALRYNPLRCKVGQGELR